MDGHVKQADGVLGEHIWRVGRDGLPVVLPAGATDPQPGELVAAQAGRTASSA